MTATNRNVLILGLIALAVLVGAYANHFNNGFHFDDGHAIVDNVHIRDLKNIPAYFNDPKMFSNDPQHWGLRPLVTTSLAIDYAIGGGYGPFYFQLSTFIWYVLLCAMLFFLYLNLLSNAFADSWKSYIALIAAAWYALHTANAETVNYIISRSDVLSTFCIMASFLIYVAYPAKRKWYLYIIPALIGVFAKETVLVLVILLFFYILLFEDELSLADLFHARNIKTVLKAILKILPLLLMVVAAQVYTLVKTAAIPGITNPMGYYWLTQTYVWLHYFISFFLPLNLSADSDLAVIRNAFDERIIMGMLFVVALIIILFKTSTKSHTRPIAFGLIWFAAALLPTSLAPFAEVANDHRMFFPFIGLALSVVAAIGLWLKKQEQQLAKYKPLLVTSILLVLALNTYGVYQRNKVWRTEESLWLDVTIKSPLNGRGLMNYGLTQMSKGNYAVADVYFNKALVLLPYYSTLYVNLGVLKGAMGKPEEARANFNKAIALAPGNYESYTFYARYLQQVKDATQARLMAERALELNPYSIMTLQVLLAVYNDLALWDKLMLTAHKALAIDGNNKVALHYLVKAKAHPVRTIKL